MKPWTGSPRMQFDRHGKRIWRQARALLDSEHARRAAGEVAVPYGVCTEPSNVAAGGQDCLVRFRCVGYGHFRTDVSYPDLEAYFADLLRNRERLAAFAADSWAKAEAMPSDSAHPPTNSNAASPSSNRSLPGDEAMWRSGRRSWTQHRSRTGNSPGLCIRHLEGPGPACLTS